jgi:biopolymer transport protein ExbD
MYHAPSRRKKNTEITKPNLIPILDAVFIFIFFLLMSANFVKIFEISSDVPIVSNVKPKKSKKPLALTLKITNNKLIVYTGVPGRAIRSYSKLPNGEYDLEKLHSFLVGLKQRFIEEKTIVMEPMVDLSYEVLVKVMDSVLMLRNTDPFMTRKEKGFDVKVKELFNNIIFANIAS